MRIKFLIPVLMISLAAMVACGDDPVEPSFPDNTPEDGGDGHDWVYSFVVEEDGITYRCFHSRDYRGGLWCTERETS